MLPPKSIQIVLDVASFCGRYFFLIVPAVVGLLWCDGKAYAALYRRYGKGIAGAWAWVVVAALVTSASYAVFAMILARKGGY